MGTAPSGDKGILLGWASTSITPDRPAQLCGQFHERISEFVHDPVTATALAITSAEDAGVGGQAIIISCDLVLITAEVQERTRAALARRIPEFDPRMLFISATHTHTAPTLVDGWYPPPGPGVLSPGEYVTFLVERLVEVAGAAWNARQPAGVSWALARAVIGHNRRVQYGDGTAQMYGGTAKDGFLSLEGGEDSGIETLFCWSADRQITGIVVNPACPSQVVEMKNYISADYWSEARRILRERYGANLFVLPWCSAAGDQSPRDMVRRNRGEPSFYSEAGLTEIGTRIAEAVDRAYSTAAESIELRPVLRHVVEDLALPVRKVTPEEGEAARAEYEKLVSTPNLDMQQNTWRVLRYKKVMDRFAAQETNPTFPVELHVLRLGDIAVATNPFELYLDYGLRIKARSKALQTFVVQLCSGCGGYLPTAKAVPGGGYSAMIYDNEVGPQGGQMLVDRTVALINALWENETK